jgi:integrase
MLKSILSAFTLPAESDDLCVRGLGVTPDVLTIAMIVCPNVLDRWTRWNGRRRHEIYRLAGLTEPTAMADDNADDEADRTPTEKYSYRDAQVITDWASLLRKETGWLRQRPDLALNLKPIPGFINEDFIERARREWDKVCEEAYAYYIQFATTIEAAAEELRNPFEPVMPILDSENPMTSLRVFAQNILNDMPDKYSSPFLVATHMRNYLIVRLLSATALRSKNIRQLTFREDGKGHLRREDGRWVIEIPYMNFKNWRSSFFGTKNKRENYRKILTDSDGLYDHLEEYVKVHRPRLLKGTTSDILLVASAKNPEFTVTYFGACYASLTMYYLAHNRYLGRGIPGVLPHGPHSVRDIVATYIVKKTGSFALAGYAIQDTEATARKYYTRFLPKDKINMADKILNEGYLS